LWAITAQGQLHVVDRASGAVQRTWQPPPDIRHTPVGAAAWLADGRVVLSHTYHKFLWDPEANLVVRQFTGALGAFEAILPSPAGRYFLTAGNDQTLRIWGPNQQIPLLSLFFPDQVWLAGTEEGFYAPPPGGEQLTGWPANNAPDHPASFYPAAQFRRSLYHPDVIRHVLAAGSVEGAFQRAGKPYSRGLNV